MTERTVSIKIGVEGAGQLAALQKQLAYVKANSMQNIAIRAGDIGQANRLLARTRQDMQGIGKDAAVLGSSLAVGLGPIAQYQKLLSGAAQAARTLGAGATWALRNASVELAKQRDLATFWGTSGYMHRGVDSLKTNLASFLSGSGSGFTGWLRDASSNLAQYRSALAVSAAAMIAFSAAAGLSSKHSQNYIKSTLDSRLMARKLTDRKSAENWIQEAQSVDWSGGRDSRMSVFQTVLSKNKALGQQGAQKATEDIEKFFFANQEMLAKKGFTSAEQLASAISAPQLTGDDATKFEDIFGLGFSNMTAQARLGRLSTEAQGIDINAAVAARPDEVLQKRLNAATSSIGDSVVPVLNQVLGLFLDISNAVGKIPGLPQAIGWATVLAGAASAGLIVVSMIGSLVPGLLTAAGLFSKLSLATKGAAAAQWVLNVAMSANPLGIAILGIAALAIGLYALEKRFHIFSKAWQAFGDSSTGKNVFAWIERGKKSLSDLLSGKGASGALKVGLDILGATSPGFKILAIIADFLIKLHSNSSNLNKLFGTGLNYWSKLTEFVGWLTRMIESGIQYLKNSFGATKSEAKSKYEKLAERGGYTFDESKGIWRKGGLQVSEEDVPAGVRRAWSDYTNAPPSVFERIPDAIKSALASWSPDISIDGLDDLSEAISSLQAAIEQFKLPSAGEIKDKITPTVVTPKSEVYWPISGGEPLTEAEWLKLPAGERTANYRYSARGNPFEQMASGGSIIASGRVFAHGGEEISNAADVRKGGSTLGKINEIFSEGRAGGGQPVINISLHQEVHVDKVSSEQDINRMISRLSDEGADKLVFSLRSRLDGATHRGISYLRG